MCPGVFSGIGEFTIHKEHVAPVWRLLSPEASLKIRSANYERVFNEGRRRVREWERMPAK